MELATPFLLISIPIVFLSSFGVLVLIVEFLTHYVVSRSDSSTTTFPCPSYSDHYYTAYGCDDDDVVDKPSGCYRTIRIGRAHAEEECVFCLCTVEEEDEIRELRCDHVFHRACLDRWFDHGHSTCPLCRRSLVAAEMEADVASQSKLAVWPATTSS